MIKIPTNTKDSNVDFKTIQVGKIKSNKDIQRSGRLQVWLVNSNTNEVDESQTYNLVYASPFAGITNPDSISKTAIESPDQSPQSYGFFAVPPDINNYVLCAFVNGNPDQGYWFACLYREQLNQMVPGIGKAISYQDRSGKLPTSEVNPFSNQANKQPTRPQYSPLANGLKKQGLVDDDLRGAGTSSSRRDEIPSVMGWLSPGGNHIVLDDKKGNELIRIRTKSGAQILISESEGHIYAISRDGKTWIELNNDGIIDLYGSVSFNLHAENIVNLTSKNVNVLGSENINISGQNIKITSSTSLDLKASGNLNLTGGNINILSNGQMLVTASPLHLNGPPAPPASPATPPTRKPTKEPFKER